MGLVSPNELMTAASDAMLGGADPASYEDWFKIFNFLAANILPAAQPDALLLLSKIYNEPLDEREIRAISAFQTMHRR